MDPYVKLAQTAIEAYIGERRVIAPPEDLPKELLEKKAGVFVTIMQAKELKGCIGTYLPQAKNIAEETIRNAIAAATEDYRFSPIRETDLGSLSYTVYLLGEPAEVKKENELNPKKFGIIVKSGRKTGLLLPDLEGVETIEQQVSIACQKGGIDPAQDRFSVYKFTAEKHE